MKIQACSINCKRSMYESYRYFSFLNYLYLPVILTKLNEKKKKTERIQRYIDHYSLSSATTKSIEGLLSK